MGLRVVFAVWVYGLYSQYGFTGSIRSMGLRVVFAVWVYG